MISEAPPHNSELKNVSPSFLLSVLECGTQALSTFLDGGIRHVDMETEKSKHFKESDFMLPHVTRGGLWADD